MRNKVIAGALVTVALVTFINAEYQAQSLCLHRLSLDSPESALTVGDSVPFGAGRTDLMMECDLDPPIGVRWKSTNPKILKVASSGWVTAQAPGLATVVVRAGVTGSARVDIRVIAPHP